MTALLKKKNPADVDCSWKLDRLDRKTVADYLTKVIGSIRQPFVISLNAPYGTGKTFFVRSWQKQLIADGYKAVYFNAWETDYSEDALIAFIGSIKSQIEKDSGEEIAQEAADLARKVGAYLIPKIFPSMAKEQLQAMMGRATGIKLNRLIKDIFGFLVKAKQWFVYFIRKTFPVLVKGVLGKYLGTPAVEILHLPEKSRDDIADLFGEIAAESLKQHEAADKAIASFREHLKGLVEKLTTTADDDKKKLIILVDELDRCRPLFALEVLECIKHLFGVPGVVFVLAVDAVQLKSVVSQVYGLGEHGEGYLRKFIDWQLTLPAPSAYQYARYMYDEFKFDETKKFREGIEYFIGKDAFTGTFGVLADAYKLSLREMAQIFTECNLFLRSAPHGVCGGSLLAIIAILRHLYPEELKKICLGKMSCSKLLDDLEIKLSQDAIRNYIPNWPRFKQLTHACFIGEQEYQELDNELIGLPIVGSDAFHELDQKRQEEISERKKYIEALFERRSGSIPSYGDVTPAAAIFKGLEQASFLTVNNAKNH